jgi:uncharacterized membrane protein SirB2
LSRGKSLNKPGDAVYSWIKLLHVTCVALSFSLFFGRGLWLFTGTRRALWGWLRIMPHIVDTLLLASGLTLAVFIHQYPFVNSGWLTAKVLGLVAYVAFGMVALHYRRSRLVARAAWVVAMLVFAYIVSVAITKQPMGFLAPHVF